MWPPDRHRTAGVSLPLHDVTQLIQQTTYSAHTHTTTTLFHQCDMTSSARASHLPLPSGPLAANRRHDHAASPLPLEQERCAAKRFQTRAAPQNYSHEPPRGDDRSAARAPSERAECGGADRMQSHCRSAHITKVMRLLPSAHVCAQKRMQSPVRAWPPLLIDDLPRIAPQ